ncbi:FAD-dependent monooxygenase [Streptomyces sp. NPDC088387]|uniref:FAD-dependent monooxygenase n=1 Tax=Streptomyces sp. NPDC088387 TaxID=3365859 RepID=UPI0037F5FC3F
MDVDVVVVGGGPVGLLVAAELGVLGVSVVVVDAELGVSEWPRARVVHARALQGLVRRGYLGELVPGLDGVGSAAVLDGVGAGTVGAGVGAAVGFRFGGVGGLSLRVPAGEPGPLLVRPQGELERLFEARARGCGVRVLRGFRVVELADDGRGVSVAAEGRTGERVEFRGLFAVGADGGRGVVRELGGFVARQWGATVSGLAGVVRWEGAEALAAGWHRTERGWVVVHELAGVGAHVKTLDCSGPHPRRRVAPSAGELAGEMSRIVGRSVGVRDVRWLSRFSDFARVAAGFRRGRVFLAGDAAHTHFPVGAQGLSLGVQDALNLAWKLALAVRGRAGDELLDSYDEERRPQALRVVESVRGQLALMRPGREGDALRLMFARRMAAGRDEGALGEMVSGQDTVLPGCGGAESGSAGRFLPNMRVRVGGHGTDVIGLLRAGRPLLVTFGAQAARYAEQVRPWGPVVRVVRAERTADAPCEALLVRPDGYVAWASDDAGGVLDEVLARYFGRPARPADFPVGRPRPAAAGARTGAAGARTGAAAEAAVPVFS